MPTFEIELEHNGKTFILEIEGPRKPTEAEVQALLARQTTPRIPTVAEESLEEAFPTALIPRPERAGEVGAFAGEVAGGIAGTLTGPLAPLARPVGAAVGAGVGSQVERVMRGQPFDIQQGTVEAVLSLVPEAAESLGRAVGRGALRLLRGAQRLRLDEAAALAQQGGQRVFRPPSERQAAQLFAIFDQAGTTASLQSAKAIVDGLESNEKRRVLRQLARLDPGGTQALAAGGDLSLQQLQNFRSLIGQQRELMRQSGVPGAARTRQLLSQVQQQIDTAIDTTLEGIQLGGAAQTAREAWHRHKAADRLGQLLTTSPVTKSVEGGDFLEFHLDRLDNLLKDNKNRLARQVNQDLARVPGASAAFTQLREEIKRVVPSGMIEISDVSGLRRFAAVAAVDRMLSEVLTSRMGLSLFRQAVVFGRGRLSLNTLATIVNAMSRQAGAADPRQHLAPSGFGGRFPSAAVQLPETTLGLSIVGR